MAARSMRHGLYMGRPDNYVGRSVDLTGRPMNRPMCYSVLKGACAYAGVFFSLFFSPSGLRGTAAFGPLDAHNQHPLLTQFCSTNDSVGWLPVDHHFLVLLRRPQQQQQQLQQHVLLQHPVLLQYTLLQRPPLAKITSVQDVIFWRRRSTLRVVRT